MYRSIFLHSGVGTAGEAPAREGWFRRLIRAFGRGARRVGRAIRGGAGMVFGRGGGANTVLGRGGRGTRARI